MGSPAFAVPSLKALVAAGYPVVAAVTQPDKPAGRGGKVTPPEVKRAAAELGVPVLQPASVRKQEAQDALAAFQADLFIVAAYGKLLPQAVLDMPSRGCVNVHASLLPRWRGASPIAAAILAGDVVTGVSVMEMALAMDAGAVIRRAAVPIGPADTTGTLEMRLAELGARTLIEALPAWFDRELAAEPQAEAEVTVCKLLTKADGHLGAGMSAGEAGRAVRAYNPRPGAFVIYRGERLMTWEAHPVELAGEVAPGSLIRQGRAPVVAFRDGGLALDVVQRPGGKRLTGEQFVNGERGDLAPQVELA
jgi:methionyl-tRNA formyltransferase